MALKPWRYVSPVESGAQQMLNDWTWEVVSAAPLEVIDGDRGKNYPKRDEMSSYGHCLFLNAGNVTSSGFNFSECSFISSSADRLLRQGKLSPNDIVLTTRGTVGNVAYYGENVPYDHIRINSGMVILRPETSYLDPRFLYMFVRSPGFSEQIGSLTTGSAQPQLPIRDINRVRIPLPPLPEQRRIAHILGTLDDKIELNRQMNRTLEEMARTLFKAWFVDFAPVRAKAEGRDTGLPAEIAELFPARLVDSELGEIPEGWGATQLGNLCAQISSGGTPDTRIPEYWNGDIPWLSSGETRESFVITTEQSITASGVENSSTRRARPYSVVIAGAGQGHTRGQTSLLLLDTYVNQSVVMLEANNSVCPDLYLYFDLSRRYEEFRQMSDSHSSRGSLTTKLLSNLKVLQSQLQVMRQFEAIAAPMVSRIKVNLEENRTLAELRDTLLPRLLSGELRVGAAEEVVGDVV